ncbi:MAG: hypothetical protein ACI81R_001259 [Bradymonadia bacterium]
MGVCGAVCGDGQTQCGDECIDVESNAEHCGGCDIVCGAGASQSVVCDEGLCVQMCNEGFVDVDGFAGCEYECTPTSPRQERCDGIDNDCDGLVDDTDSDLLTAPCPQQAGVCEGARFVCIAGELAGCDAEDYSRVASPDLYVDGAELLCDGVDNNCDGQADESCCPTIGLDLTQRTAGSVLPGVPLMFGRVVGASDLTTLVLSDAESWPVSTFGLAEVRGSVLRPVLGIRTVPDERTWGLGVAAEQIDGQLRWTTATIAGIREGFTDDRAEGPSGFAYIDDAAVDGRAVRGITVAEHRGERWVATLREEPRTDELTLVVQRFDETGAAAELYEHVTPLPMRTDLVSWANADTVSICAPEDGDTVGELICWTFEHDLTSIDRRSAGSRSVVDLMRQPIANGDGTASVSTARVPLTCEFGRCEAELLDVRLGALGGPIVSDVGSSSEYTIGGQYEGVDGERWWLTAALSDAVVGEFEITLSRERLGELTPIATMTSVDAVTLLTVLYRDGIAYPVFRYGIYGQPTRIAMFAVTETGDVLCEPLGDD